MQDICRNIYNEKILQKIKIRVLKVLLVNSGVGKFILTILIHYGAGPAPSCLSNIISNWPCLMKVPVQHLNA